MKHLFVPYELAVKLKEKGFDEECLGYYHEKMSGNPLTFIWEDDMYPTSNSEMLRLSKNSNVVMAPMYQQAIDWLFKKLREKESAFIYIEIHSDNSGEWVFSSQPEIEYEGKRIYFNNLEEAIEEALKLI